MNTESLLTLNLQNALQKQQDLQDYVLRLQNELNNKSPKLKRTTELQNELFEFKQQSEHLSFQLEQQIITNVQLNKINQKIQNELNELKEKQKIIEQKITQDNSTQTEMSEQSYIQVSNLFSQLASENAETVDKTINMIYKNITDLKGYKIVITSQKVIEQIKHKIKAREDYEFTYRLIPDLLWILEQKGK
ncbi:Hypothetical_protein [Hexamita inflata]|uniref:Hypothetical_protein n=1 Tax=Hexamita inflata TaxID=28002 RepID=A0ABP1GXH1_9EUKA